MKTYHGCELIFVVDGIEIYREPEGGDYMLIPLNSSYPHWFYHPSDASFSNQCIPDGEFTPEQEAAVTEFCKAHYNLHS